MTLRSRLLLGFGWAQRHGMPLLVVALLVWMWCLSIWFNQQQKRQLLVDRGAELALMADAVAQHSAGVLGAVESDLRTLDLWLLTHPQSDPLRDPAFIVLIDEIRRSSRGLIEVRMVSDSGMLYLLPSPGGKAQVDVSDREYVKVHANEKCLNACNVHVGAPVHSRVTKRWDIPVSLRLSAPTSARSASAPDGRVRLNILFAAVSLDRLAGEHERMRFKPDGVITLVRSDGLILSRAPTVSAYMGLDLSGSAHFDRDFGQKPAGTFVSDGKLTDGLSRLVSYERLTDFPISVLVSRSLNDIYDSYYQRIRTALVLSVALSMVVLGSLMFMLKSRNTQRVMMGVQEHFRRLATIDELTGVMNRRAFMEAAQREFERAQRYNRPTAVLALDIDHFKSVNDEYGHSGGDLALQVCASRWQLALREHDLLGRIGGEEFCVLLPETSEAGALLIAERLRSLTVGTPAVGNTKRVSVSVGWTLVEATDPGWSVVLRRADDALYGAKADGRNCVRPMAPDPQGVATETVAARVVALNARRRQVN